MSSIRYFYIFSYLILILFYINFVNSFYVANGIAAAIVVALQQT